MHGRDFAHRLCPTACLTIAILVACVRFAGGLTPDEKELGVALIDIGGGTTDLAIFEKGALWHTSVLQVGGEHFTNDVAVALRTPVNEAEKIKKQLEDAGATVELK